MPYGSFEVMEYPSVKLYSTSSLAEDGLVASVGLQEVFHRTLRFALRLFSVAGQDHFYLLIVSHILVGAHCFLVCATSPGVLQEWRITE